MAFTDVLKKAYPFLTAFAQYVPGGNIATTALGQILSLKSGATLDDAGAALMNATPEQRAALQAEDNRHKEVIAQMGYTDALEFEKALAADRASARDMQVKTRSWLPNILAGCAVATLAFCIYMVGFRELKPGGHDAIIMLLGAVIAIVKDVFGWQFGSSAGSDRKTELMAQAQDQK